MSLFRKNPSTAIRFTFLFVIAVTMLFFTQPVKADITTGLQAYYHYDDNTGTSATDSSGNGYTGTLLGGTNGEAWVSSPNTTFNYALQFKDNGGGVNSSFAITGSWTFSFWGTITSCPTYSRALSSKAGGMEIACYPTTFVWNIYDTTHGWVSSGYAAKAGWTHYVFTRDSSGKLRILFPSTSGSEFSYVSNNSRGVWR